MNLYRFSKRRFHFLRKTTHKFNPYVFMDVAINSKVEGRIVFELFYKDLPKTSLNFKALCAGYKDANGKLWSYKGTPFHRIIPGVLVQGGDVVNKNGTGNFSIYGDTFPDESFKYRHEHSGMLSMANSGSNTNGSQFFITTEFAPYFDYKYVSFGIVHEGMDVLSKIEKLGTTTGKPSSSAIIHDCGVVEDHHHDHDCHHEHHGHEHASHSH